MWKPRASRTVTAFLTGAFKALRRHSALHLSVVGFDEAGGNDHPVVREVRTLMLIASSPAWTHVVARRQRIRNFSCGLRGVNDRLGRERLVA
ncbi:MAG: hypothetical protein ACXWUH_20190, partial [Burkholderiales bacterium]